MLLNMKARLFADCGKPHKGFSLAMRAANSAQRAKLFPPLWVAIGTISNVLIHLGEYNAAQKLLDAVIPQVCRSLHVRYA